MSLFRKKIIGIDVDQDGAAFLQFDLYRGELSVSDGRISTDLKLLKSLANAAGAAVTIPGQLVFTRVFPFPPSLSRSGFNDKALAGFLQKQNLPFPLQDCHWDISVTAGQIYFFAARKDSVRKYFEDTGIPEAAVTCLVPSQVSLYNMFLHNNFISEERILVLYLGSSSSELFIFENKRFWLYPLSSGFSSFSDDKAELGKFALELKRVLGTHYLQNPSLNLKAFGSLYLSGIRLPQESVDILQRAFNDLEIKKVDPFVKIKVSSSIDKVIRAFSRDLSLANGAVLTCLAEGKNVLRVNLFKRGLCHLARDKRRWLLLRIGSLLLIGALVTATAVDSMLLLRYMREKRISSSGSRQREKMLPELKELSARKAGLKKAYSWLGKLLDEKRLMLSFVSAVASCKPASVLISELDALRKDGSLVVSLSGKSADYQGINAFVNGLKENKSFSELKISIPNAQDIKGTEKLLDFKLRFNFRP